MTALEKVKAAAKAVELVETRIAAAEGALSRRMVNGFGCYVSGWDIQTSLAVAIDELKKALRVIELAPSPTDADYDQADIEQGELQAAEFAAAELEELEERGGV